MNSNRLTVIAPPLTSTFFTYAALLHLIWAVLLLISPTAGHATTTSYLLTIIPDRFVLSAVLFGASCLALANVYQETPYSLTTALTFVPQALLVLLAATGAVQAMLLGQFGDGVQRSNWFIAADQVPAVLIACCHQFIYIRTHAPVLRRFMKWAA